MNDNQESRSEVILLQDPRNVLESHFTVCEKIRWQVEECRDEDKGFQEWGIRNGLLKNTSFVHMLYCFLVQQSR